MKKYRAYCLLVLWLLSINTLLVAQKAIVCVPVTSMWVTPNPHEAKGPFTYPLFGKDYPNHNTQLLLGERVEIVNDSKKEVKGWCKVRALEQVVLKRQNPSEWVPLSIDKCLLEWDVACRWVQEKDLTLVNEFPHYNGVISSQLAMLYEKADIKSTHVMTLSCGTLVTATLCDRGWSLLVLPDGKSAFVQSKDLLMFNALKLLLARNDLKKVRQKLVEVAKAFLGSPYCRGGRSAHQKAVTDVITGVDCSALINLAYRICGFSVPRNAFEQYKKAMSLKPKKMQAGDLIFLEHKDVLDHVMMYLENGQFIEAYGHRIRIKEDCCVRIVTDKERLGASIADLNNGDQCCDGKDTFKIYCASFLSDPKITQALLAWP